MPSDSVLIDIRSFSQGSKVTSEKRVCGFGTHLRGLIKALIVQHPITGCYSDNLEEASDNYEE